MAETTLRSITNSGIWIPMLVPTCSTMISSDEPQCQGFNQSRIQFPLSIGMLLARDSIVGIPIPCSISLRCDIWYTQSIPTVSGSCTISWSKEMILDIRKALSKRTTRSCARLRIGSCPSHHSPNDVIPLSTTSNVHGQETTTIY